MAAASELSWQRVGGPVCAQGVAGARRGSQGGNPRETVCPLSTERGAMGPQEERHPAMTAFPQLHLTAARVPDTPRPSLLSVL